MYKVRLESFFFYSLIVFNGERGGVDVGFIVWYRCSWGLNLEVFWVVKVFLGYLYFILF